MLKAVGIISEYNPFHNGHLYQLKEAKRLTGADLVVVIMSGNWVQRGEPALVDKWTRTDIAIRNGADLVIELPFQCAVQPADLFAKYAVNILGNLKCSYLSFGCENNQINFNELSHFKKIKQDIKSYLDANTPYSAAIRDYVYSKTGKRISSPNDVLGMNYAISNSALECPMKLYPVKRLGANHHDSDLNYKADISSASAIRSAILKHDNDFSKFLPNYNIHFDEIITWNAFFPYLKYMISMSSTNELSQIYQMSEGLEFKLKKEINASNSFEEFISKIKSKRYTYARLKRLCCYILLNYQNDAIFEYIRVLGFNNLGKSYLKQVKKSIDIPIISRVNKSNLNNELRYEYRAGFMTGIITNENEDLYRFPLIYK
ncbi:nucleotidyltransferase [Apilactobacillus xinyiensis]|uniref:nucleotidyltransferase n=1 Tax=Apilactobacillus xinyiensis TaxID=2841032 RepID=UPI003364EE6E